MDEVDEKFHVAACVARRAITDKLHDYCEAMDQIDADLGYEIWHQDGIACYEGIFEGTGREFVDWVLETHRKMVATFHQVTNIDIELDGDRATSSTYAFVCNRIGSTDYVMRGRYLDKWSNRNDSWRIDERHFVPAFTQYIPVVGPPS
jgi:hypothetical protein